MTRFVGSALLAAASVAAPQPAPAPVHQDAPGIEQGMLDAAKGLMRGDFKLARAGLDRVETGCRHVTAEDVPAWPAEMVEQDVAMHVALTRAREFASRERWEDTANSLVWIERCCKDCHALRAKSASPSGSESPTLPTVSRP